MWFFIIFTENVIQDLLKNNLEMAKSVNELILKDRMKTEKCVKSRIIKCLKASLNSGYVSPSKVIFIQQFLYYAHFRNHKMFWDWNSSITYGFRSSKGRLLSLPESLGTKNSVFYRCLFYFPDTKTWTSSSKLCWRRSAIALWSSIKPTSPRQLIANASNHQDNYRTMI